MKPFFSIIIAAYNSEKYLEQCLESIVNQTEKSIEIIVVNDGSCDRTKEILDAYIEKEKTSKLKVIHKKRNQGQSKAIITALEIVTGEYVSFVDSDDWIDEDYYLKIRKYLEKVPEVLITGYISEPGGIIRTNYKTDCMMSGKELIESNPVVHTSYDACFSWRMFFKTAFLKENQLLPNEKIVIGEDTEYNLRILKIAKKAMAIDYCGYHYRVDNPNSLVHQSYKKTLENDLILLYPTRKNFSEDKIYLQDMAKYYTDVMIFNVIRNAKESPNRFQIKGMRRILNEKWLLESYKLVPSSSMAFSYKERILRFCMKKRLSLICFLYYKFKRQIV